MTARALRRQPAGAGRRGAGLGRSAPGAVVDRRQEPAPVPLRSGERREPRIPHARAHRLRRAARGRRPDRRVHERLQMDRSGHGRDHADRWIPSPTGPATASTTASATGAAGCSPAPWTMPRSSAPARSIASTPICRCTSWAPTCTCPTASAGARTIACCTTRIRCAARSGPTTTTSATGAIDQPARVRARAGRGGRAGRPVRRCRGLRVERALGRLAADPLCAGRPDRARWSRCRCRSPAAPPSAARIWTCSTSARRRSG